MARKSERLTARQRQSQLIMQEKAARKRRKVMKQRLLVIGGGVCDLAPALRERYRELAEAEYKKHALDGFRNLAGMEFSVCGDDAPTIGALAWAMA